MKHDEYSWTTFDGIKVFAQSWAPEGKPRAVIALVHGLGDHSDRYPRLVEMLVGAGYAINAFDERGHGRTGGARAFTPSYEAMAKDIDQHMENTRARFPDLPIFLYGHSFGGAQVLNYVLSRKPKIRAVIASSPGLASGVHQSGVKIFLGKILSVIAPKVHIPLGSPVESLSHDPAWISASLGDPYFQTTLSTRLAMEQLRTNAWVLSAESFPLPLLIMQGTTDQHVAPQVNIDFAKRLGDNVTLKIWEGLGHELHNEVRKDEVIAYLREWLDAH